MFPASWVLIAALAFPLPATTSPGESTQVTTPPLPVLTFGADDVARLFADVENDREPGIRGDFFLHNQFHNQALVWWWKPNRRTRLRTMGAHYLVPQEARVGQNDYVNVTTAVPTFFHDGEWAHGNNTLRFGYNMAQLRTISTLAARWIR